MPYAHTTLAQARTQLLGRLQEPSTPVYWAVEELNFHIVQALRMRQALSGAYRKRLTFSTAAQSPFYDLTSLLPTDFGYAVTDVQLAKEMQYALLEPATGNSWTGTDQFTLAHLTSAITRRKAQFLTDTGCVVTRSTQEIAGNADGRFPLSESIADIRRVAWGGAVAIPEARIGLPPGLSISATGVITGTPTQSGIWTFTVSVLDSAGQTIQVICSITISDNKCFLALWREDDFSSHNFLNSWLTPANPPRFYSVSLTPPLYLQLIPIPSTNGTIELLTVNSDSSVPDDLSWAVKFGALADVLSASLQEDPTRVKYCEQMYQLGVQAAKVNPSVLAGRVDSTLVSTGSVFDFDAYRPGWECDFDRPTMIGLAGRNLVGLCPCPDSADYTITIDCAPNMAVPSVDGDYLQVGKDEVEMMVEMAFHLASFKQGGEEFILTIPQSQSFLQSSANLSARLSGSAQYKQITDNMRRLYDNYVVRTRDGSLQSGNQQGYSPQPDGGEQNA